jgi:predicted amidophosphoribosyltransferase
VRYDEVARTLVHALKYQDRTDLAPAMGRWIGARRARNARDRCRSVGGGRGTAVTIGPARVLERQCGVKLKGELLRRVRATEQQVELSRSQRANNEQGAFGYRPTSGPKSKAAAWS